MVTKSNGEWLRLLERQASVIDGLETYLAACRRRGIDDDIAEESRAQAIRGYRRVLSRAPVDVLFLYGCQVAQTRQT